MGTPDFAVPTLERLADGPDQIVGVVTQPDRPKGRQRTLTPPPVKQTAVRLGFPVFQPERIRTAEAWADISKSAPDLCVVVAYGQILGPRFLALPRLGCFNVHASLLPRWRGAAPINWAVIEGDTSTGVTIMKMELGLDTGPAVVSWQTEIGAGETAGELHDRLSVAGADLLAEVAADLRAGEALELTPQDDKLATHARMLSKDDGRVDFDLAPDRFVRHVHGVTPWPGATCETPRGKLKLLRVEGATAEPNRPGTVLAADQQQGLVVAAGGGAVRVLRCQRPGKSAVDALAFLRGSKSDMLGECWR
jgi:methionyl-tRNA formyltransferase